MVSHGGEVDHGHCWFHSTKELCFWKFDAVGPFKSSPFFLEECIGDGFQDSLFTTLYLGKGFPFDQYSSHETPPAP